MDDFRSFRYDIIEMLILEKSVRFRSEMEEYARLRLKAKEWIEETCEFEINSYRSWLNKKSTFELMVKAIEIVSKDIMEQNNCGSNSTVESQPSKLLVAGSSPVFRSNICDRGQIG